MVVVRSHPNSDNFFGRMAKKALLGGSKLDKLKAAVFYMFDVLRSIKRFLCKDHVIKQSRYNIVLCYS